MHYEGQLMQNSNQRESIIVQAAARRAHVVHKEFQRACESVDSVSGVRMA